MKINSVNLGTRLIPFYEYDYSDKLLCILKFLQLVLEPIYVSINQLVFKNFIGNFILLLPVLSYRVEVPFFF